jgi:Skp family chaperone for outer membrane proteins
MKKLVFILFLTLSSSINFAQSRGIRIAYIDMEYILQNVPDYTEAKNQLEQKAQKWKVDIETKKNEINTLKEALNSEKVLLTKELIEEREEEITYLENELLAFQQKRFGPTGDLVVQKAVLIKPIQDQVFTAVQDIAELKKYDYILDKSSDLTILFAAKRHDISDQVIRSLTRSSKREQMSRKELKALEEKERIQDYAEDTNPDKEARQKVLDERQAKRDSIVSTRKNVAEQRKKDYEERKRKVAEDREAKKNGTVSAKEEPTADEEAAGGKEADEKKPGTDSDATEETKTNPKATAADARKKADEERQRKLDERKQQLEERKQKILADREAAKNEREKPKENIDNNNEENKNNN